MSINLWIVSGRLTRDAEVIVTQNGNACLKFTVAQSEKAADKTTGQPRERVVMSVHSAEFDFNKMDNNAAEIDEKMVTILYMLKCGARLI